jgi:hypothetical protein
MTISTGSFMPIAITASVRDEVSVADCSGEETMIKPGLLWKDTPERKRLEQVQAEFAKKLGVQPTSDKSIEGNGLPGREMKGSEG